MTIARLRASALMRTLALVLVLGAFVPLPVRNRASAVGGEIDLRPPPGLRSRSLGFPWQGQLVRGLRVAESEYVRHVPEYAANGNFYATWELAQLIERAARRVAFRVPGSKLQLGEMSTSSGGRIDGHRSHESGRDVDIGFYMTMADGRPTQTYAFAEFDWRGRGYPPNQYLRFDDARNWELVAKLISDGDARVQFIFVASHLKQRLLTEAERRGASAALIERARAVLVEPGHGHPHRNHFHLRMYCPPADKLVCGDRGPFWPWYPGPTPQGGYARLSSPFRVEDEP